VFRTGQVSVFLWLLTYGFEIQDNRTFSKVYLMLLIVAALTGIRRSIRQHHQRKYQRRHPLPQPNGVPPAPITLTPSPSPEVEKDPIHHYDTAV
jgi:hypothetical protein